MPVEDQILLTLMWLRMGLVIANLAFHFRISTAAVSHIFSFWIPHLARLTRKYLIFWLSTKRIRMSLPDVFRNMPPMTCIIDCFEVYSDRPQNLLRRGQMFSFYRSHNTVKVLDAVAPNGFVTFISKAYGGRASDRYITASSVLLYHLEDGNDVLADRGFTIADILTIGVELALPSFTKGKQLAARDVVVSRRLAKLRIHVERSIRRMKCVRILNHVPSSYLAKQNNIDDILVTVAGLCNLQSALIKEPQGAGSDE
uniref:DDE Tnp4 domain-containing protein n=1 Tax=Ixodes ricinus TaxID=34613 RepID=A0A0K8R932_IXORI